MTGEEAASHLIAGLLVLFCRIFITLRGHALIMHGYMAPQTSQCFTGGEKRLHYRVTYSRIKEVYSLTECIRLSLSVIHLSLQFILYSSLIYTSFYLSVFKSINQDSESRDPI